MRYGGAIIIGVSVLGACRETTMAERLPRPDANGRWAVAALPRFAASDVRALPQRAGDTVVVALWATWCTPCVEEMPELDAFAKAHPDVAVLGVLADADNASAAQAILDRVRPSYAQVALAGGEGPFLEALGLAWEGILPVTFIHRSDRTRLVEPPATRATLEAASSAAP